MNILRLPAVQMICYGAIAKLIALWIPYAQFEFFAQAYLAALLLGAGMLILVFSAKLFRRSRTSINPLQPEQATSLVIQGLYRYTRNPMYLAFSLILIAYLLYLGNYYAFLLVPLYMLSITHFNIRPEEHALRQRFGHDYDHYCATVRRWL